MKFEEHPLKDTLKLFMFDLDGTALGGHLPYIRIPDAFSDLLDDLHEHGCRWAINTTWDPHGQWELVRQSKVKSRPLFYAGEFGKVIAEDGTDDAVLVNDYCQANADRVREVRQREMLPLFRQLIGKDMYEKAHDWGHLFEVVFAPEVRHELPQLGEAVKRDFPGLSVRVTESAISARPTFLNKGLALKEIIRLTGFRPAEILTAGDEEPDLAMMMPDCALYTVCPSQAAEIVKETVLARNGRVGRQPYSDGVIDAFMRLEQIPDRN